MIKVVKLTQTCGACPAQWDAWDSEGTYYYIRYRHGHFSVWVGETVETEQVILEKDIGDPLDGYMNFDELREYTKELFDFTAPEDISSMDLDYDPEAEQDFIDWLESIALKRHKEGLDNLNEVEYNNINLDTDMEG